MNDYLMIIGYPIAAVPISSIDYKSRPVGLQVISSAHREDLLIAFMSAFEDSISKRLLPPPSLRFLRSQKYITSKLCLSRTYVQVSSEESTLFSLF